MKDYSKIRGELDGILSERIMILDGAMGTRIQSFSLGEDDFRGGRFATHPVPIAGNNDLLSLTRPDIIEGIHREYLDAGVDIIETNTFNSNALSQADYGLAEIVGELNMESAQLACRAAERYVAENPGRKVFVAGSIGPTGKTCSMSPDVNDPGFRDIRFDDLEKIYFQAARALVEGGVDILLLETVFDTLNAKAAISALSRLNDELGVRVPLMISATISDASGRTLSGQTIEAFVNSVSHAENLLSLGLNCALGARGMRPHIEELSGCAAVHVSAHPNAGLPNAFGKYDQSPAEMAELVADFATSGFVNILGGCCGSTPEHIAAIARAVADIAPRRKLPDRRRCCRLSGLEPLNISPEMNFVNIGERTNVSGSRKFLRLIKEKNHEEALIIAREQVENGAQIIDVNMDDGMLEGADEMQRFLNLSASEPEISRVPVMVDSSDFEVIVAGLKCLQGRGIVNSISLKEGEAEFLRKARTVKRLGAAVLVMCFDEHGQADTLERRVAVARRSIELLTGKCGYLPEQIVIDPNVFAIGTGIEEHDNYARDFIEAISNIKSENPGVLVSGGVSNMSFSFRGNDAIREVMHSVFLYHAIAKGMDMGIVNPGQLTVYDEIPEDIRGIVEDAVFNTSPGASEKLLKLAENIQFRGKRQEQDNSWREGSADERIMHALVKGFADHIESDVEECRLRDPEHPVAVIEDSLMKGIEKVGQLFGAGKMFLPQVVKSARVMKKAVAYLMPYIEAKRSGEKLSTSAGKIVLATVKGDVHDIGKNIAAVVLRCNNYEVVDLGVMVPCERILDAARSENADIVGLSGLITPSLEEMVHVAAEMQRGNLHIPLLVGGAATSKLHLAVKIEPVRKNGPCIYVPDASRGVSIVNSLMNKALRDKFINAESDECKKLRNSHGKAERNMIPLEDARKNRYAPDFNSHPPAEPRKIGTWTITDQSIDELVPLIDWNPFFSAWEIKGRYPDVLDDPTKGEEARKLHNDALEMLKDIALHGYLKGKAVYGIFPACSKDDDVLLFSHKDPAIQSSTLHFLRDQKARKNGVANLALPDFLLPCGSSRQDHIGLFALTTGIGADEQAKIFSDAGDDYSAIMLATLANCLAEAFAEHLHSIVCRDVWACSANSSPTGIRPAPGYPCCPDHSLKNNIFDILDATRNIGVTLSETTSMSPSASVAGFYFTHKQSSYFNIAHVAMDQLEDYARRSKTDTADAAKKLAHLL